MTTTQAATKPRTRISFKVVQHALYFFGDSNLGVQPDHFERRLFQLLSAATQDELDRLATIYPEHVAAFELGRNSWGVEALRQRAKGDLNAIPNQLDLPASGEIPAGHALHDGKVVPLSGTYVITRCQSVNAHQQACIFPPAHPGLHRADTGRAWSA
ncbi:hypothetical protein [Microbacterium sp. 77mftsu3.1]|uniref:hypothetical protein n=1 Tax=Microbacterium sp. 77mftsu3.1 TaxID=1761802 RepID=UPI0003787618|nr:hypothetical protein [Microbacterium sp. 77mftsu3.1]SDG23203.1 hypothetical protein SAMN04488590_0263 [Microbacterium sp. 77mftsu3.1]